MDIKRETVHFERRDELPSESGIYALTVNSIVMYVGKSSNLKNRWKSHGTASQCRESLSLGQEVRISFWRIAEERITACEQAILRFGHFKWSLDSLGLAFGKCGELILNRPDNQGAQEFHERECEDCQAHKFLSTRLSALSGAINTLMMEVEKAGIWVLSSPVTPSNGLHKFETVFGDRGIKLADHVNALGAKIRHMESSFSERRRQEHQRYAEMLSPSLDTISRLINDNLTGSSD